MFKRIAAFTAAVALGVGGFAASASADEVVSGNSASNPIIVSSPDDVPGGARENAVSTYDTAAKCDTTRSWVLPGSDAVTHEEQRYSRTVPAVDETSHLVYAYERQVELFKTQYQLAQYVRERSRSADIWQNWSPNKDQGPFEGPPSWPTDERGTWQHTDKAIPPGHEGPDGVYQQGNGNGDWFYRQAGVVGEWGPWTLVEGSEEWSDNDSSVGEPVFDGDDKQTQVRPTGETRQVSNGFDKELSGEVLETRAGLWVLLAGYPKVVVDTEAQPAYTEYYVVDSEPSNDVDDASWVNDSPGESWTEFDSRVVTDQEAVADQYFAWSDEAECEVVIVKTPPTKTVITRTLPPTETVTFQELAHTGFEGKNLLGAALALILAGGTAVWATRRGSQI